MKICIAIEKFDPSVGGAERYCWDLAHFLAEKGHDVAITCIKAKDPLHPSISIIEVMCLRFPQALRHLSFAVMHYLKARGLPDHIHFCVGNTFYMDIYQPHGGLHRAWFMRETQRYSPAARRLIRLMKRLSPKDIVQRVMEWWVFRITRPQVIAISEMVSNDIQTRFKYPDSMIHLIANGIDQGRFSPVNRQYREAIRQRYHLDRDDFVFVFVAQNLTLKGFDILLRACSELKDRSFRVLVIGPADASARKKAAQFGDKIVLGGRASDLEKIYPACDCLVHPTYYDACSLVILESLASGVPVITTSANGAKMYVRGENGYVIPPGDVHALVEAMNAVLLTRKERHMDIVFQDHAGVFAHLERLMENHAE